MKRFVIAAFAIIACFIGICAAIVVVIVFTLPTVDRFDVLYLYGGTAIVSFVVSWLLLKISRQK